jgi:hypothetical protein
MFNPAITCTCRLITEWSTIFLNLRSLKRIWIDVVFVLTFVLFRGFVGPYLWWRWISRYQSQRPAVESCFSEAVYYCVLFGGGFFNLLNMYWGQIIVRRMSAKLSESSMMPSAQWVPEAGQRRNVNAMPRKFSKRGDTDTSDNDSVAPSTQRSAQRRRKHED